MTVLVAEDTDELQPFFSFPFPCAAERASLRSWRDLSAQSVSRLTVRGLLLPSCSGQCSRLVGPSCTHLLIVAVVCLWERPCSRPPPPPLSTSLEWSIGEASADTHGSSAVAGVARTLLYTASDCLRDSGSGFFLRVDSRSLSHEWVWPQGSGGLKLGFSFS